MTKSTILLAVAWLALAGGCTRLPHTGLTSLKSTAMGELQGYLLSHKADLDQFRLRGPFAVTTQHDHEVRLSATEHIDADLFLSAHPDKAPLVILLHGLDSTKEDHAYQAMHLASWGMHCLTVQLPNKGSWIANGKTLAEIVNFIYRQPGRIDSRIDTSKIILAGHSFGGAAVAVALAEGAPAIGGILLDPAASDRSLPGFLKQIKAPVMVLGADEHLSATLNRGYFYRFIRGGVAEVSIKDATHEDGQFPAELPLLASGTDPHATEELQITFVSALTAAAMSLSATGKFDYAWASFGEAFEHGKLFNAKKK